jgi:ketosteroid isomerase-like protein
MDMREPELVGADRVRALFARVRDADDGAAADLYAADGVVVYGGGRIEGREAIRAFYRRTMDAIRPQPQVVKVLESGDRYLAFVEVATANGPQRAVDLFELGDGGIRRLVIFSDN